MVIDTSAIIAIFEQEAGYEQVQDVILTHHPLYICAATLLEIYMIVLRRRGDDGWQDILEFMDICEIEIVPLSLAELKHAMDGFSRYGKGGGSGVNLNYGDCFSYGLAKSLDMPLLFVGSDFAKTDIKTALQ